MRIFLLPISTRRTLIYCERIQSQLNGSHQPAPAYSIGSITDKIVNKANATWAEWENAEKGWKKKLTVYGNDLVFSRIAFEEWQVTLYIPAVHLLDRNRIVRGL